MSLICTVLFCTFFTYFFVVYASETNEICFCLLESMLYFPIIEHLVFVKCTTNLSNRKTASLSVPGQEFTCAVIFILKKYLEAETRKCQPNILHSGENLQVNAGNSLLPSNVYLAKAVLPQGSNKPLPKSFVQEGNSGKWCIPVSLRNKHLQIFS